MPYSDNYDARIKRVMRSQMRGFMRDNPEAVCTIDKLAGVAILRVPSPGTSYDRVTFAYRSNKDTHCDLHAKCAAIERFNAGQTVLVPRDWVISVSGWSIDHGFCDVMAYATKT